MAAMRVVLLKRGSSCGGQAWARLEQAGEGKQGPPVLSHIVHMPAHHLSPLPSPPA